MIRNNNKGNPIARSVVPISPRPRSPLRFPPLVVVLVAWALTITSPSHADSRCLLILGDSLTAGYGISREKAYPALLQELASEHGFTLRVRNAGLSGDTSAGGVRRVAPLLKEPCDLFMVALGGNDALRGLPVTELERNLSVTLERVRAAWPTAALIIAGMEAPPNMGVAYQQSFRSVYVRVAAKFDATLIPFLLEGVAAEPTLNLSDGIHPNELGHAKMAQLVWRILRPLIAKTK